MTIRDQVLAVFKQAGNERGLCNDEVRNLLPRIQYKAVEEATRELFNRGLLTREWGAVKAGTKSWRVVDLGRCYYYKLVAADGYHRVSLTFLLKEDVTPEIFAERVAAACFKHYALREYEGVETPAGRWILRGEG